jgi:hypothetical protein
MPSAVTAASLTGAARPRQGHAPSKEIYVKAIKPIGGPSFTASPDTLHRLDAEFASPWLADGALVELTPAEYEAERKRITHPITDTDRITVLEQRVQALEAKGP